MTKGLTQKRNYVIWLIVSTSNDHRFRARGRRRSGRSVARSGAKVRTVFDISWFEALTYMTSWKMGGL
jgi:hypothetical protein